MENKELSTSPKELDNLIKTANFKMPSNGVASFRGIDISHWDGSIDWSALKNSKTVDVVYIKSTEGRTGHANDPMFETNYNGAKAAGFKIGFYHFLDLDENFGSDMSKYTESGELEAINCFNVVKNHSFDALFALDVESNSAGLTGAAIVTKIKGFINKFQSLMNNNQTIMIYSSPSFINEYFDVSLAQYPLWIAHYNVLQPADTAVWSSYYGWQYNDKGKYAGINANVDEDHFTANIFVIGNIPTPTPTPKPAPVPIFHGDPTVLSYQQKLNTIKIPRPLLSEDGLTGPKTTNAIKVLEQVGGISVDGIWGPQCENVYKTICARPLLKRGSRGVCVKFLQYQLGISFDGIFGQDTEKRVKLFQTQHKLSADGIVGTNTWKAIF